MTTENAETGETTEVDVPVGLYCWACAVALECWGDDKEGTCARYHAETGFMALVDAAKIAVAHAKDSLLLERVKAIRTPRSQQR